MVATASSAAADISSQLESVHPQFSATTEPVHNSVGVAVRLGSDGSTGNRSESPTSEEPEENCAPMDLSSGGGGGGGVASQAMMAATPTFMQAMAAAAVANNATPTSLADSLLNARRIAEFVRAQQLRNQEIEAATPTKIDNSPPPMLPRKRAWPELQLDLSAIVSEKLKKKSTEQALDGRENSGGPTSPGTESNSSGGGTATPISANKEVKKRRLDQLLSKKFSVNDSPPPQPCLPPVPPKNQIVPEDLTPSPVNMGVAANQHMPLPVRRDSSEKKKNRRKPSSPQSSIPASPVTLSLRPNSELFNQAHQPDLANETNNLANLAKSELPEPNMEKSQPPKIEFPPENPNHNNVADTGKNSLKNQLLQMHLAQAALLNQTSSNLFPGLPGLPGLPGVPPGPPNPAAAGGNPLLYYGYYAQMIQGLQSQQQKLLEQLTGKNAAKNILPSSPISTKVCHSL